jgi:E3 ubiquitin-protein ligase synoviolin
VFVGYVELAADLIKLLLYVGFFAALTNYYGVPLHLMRDMFVTLRSFVTRLGDFIAARRVRPFFFKKARVPS